MRWIRGCGGRCRGALTSAYGGATRLGGLWGAPWRIDKRLFLANNGEGLRDALDPRLPWTL